MYGVKGTALKWFESYLSDCIQSVVIDGVESELLNLIFGVLKGSVLKAISFILYTSPLGDLFRQSSIFYHFYANDTQPYMCFTGGSLGDSALLPFLKTQMSSNSTMIRVYDFSPQFLLDRHGLVLTGSCLYVSRDTMTIF